MKLYIRADFIKLPKGTIYSRVCKNDDLMQGLYCKVDELIGDDDYNDWCEQNLISEIGFPNGIDNGMQAQEYVNKLRDSFQEFRTDLDCSGRDGCFDDSDSFIVWDRKDIEKLVNYLNNILVRGVN